MAFVIFTDSDNNVIGYSPNTITNSYLEEHAQYLIGGANTSPSHIAFGVGSLLSTEIEETRTELKNEVYRGVLTGKSAYLEHVAKLAATFVTAEGTGTISEVGLFNAAAVIGVRHNCDSTSGWGGSGFPTLDNTEYILFDSSRSLSNVQSTDQ